jgi:hypothetical protein
MQHIVAFIKDVRHLKIMMEIRTLITQVLMPRIRHLEEEVASLRKHTWPYIQAMKEHNQLDDIQAKRDFARHLDDTTLLELIRLKAQYSKNGGGSGLREYDLVRRNCPSGTF